MIQHALRPASCTMGVHRPSRSRAWVEGEIRRTLCRDCGCTLMRTAATRKWYLAGLLADQI